MIYLKQSTAVDVVLGPFVDDTDGKTTEEALTLAQADLQLSKNGAAAAQKNDATSATHRYGGNYMVDLNTTDTNTLGHLRLMCKESGALPVIIDFMVVTANWYDTMCSTDQLDVNVTNVAGTSQTANDNGADINAILVDTNELQGNQGDWATVTGFATEAKQDTIDGIVDDILVDTAEIGVAGAGLTSIGTIATVTDVTNQVTADMTAISGDSTAADNLESQYDTTGLSGDTYPATQAQISNIANVGSAVNTPASSYTLTTGTQTANLYTDTKALNGTRHTHTDTGNAMVLEYEFNVGAGIPSSVHVTGALTGGNDDLEVLAYDYVAAGYIQIGILAGKVSSANEVNSYDLFTSMVGTGANLGEVKIKLQDGGYTLSGATLYIDQIYVSFSAASSSYENGAIWVDDSVSNTNTVPGIDGVATNPVSTWAAALTLSAATNLNKFQIANGTSIQLTADSSNFSLMGDEWDLDLNGQIIANIHVEQSSISGTGTGTSYRFIKCKIALESAISVEAGGFNDCALGSAGITLSAAGTLLMKQCSPINGSVYIDFENAAEAKTIQMTPYNGDIEFRNFGYNGVVHKVVLTGQGHVIFNANCSNATADDILDIHGMFHITDNVSTWGGTINEEARYAVEYVADSVWDEVLTAGTHNISTSAGRRLRDLATSVIITGTSPDTAGTANTSTRIELDGDASATDGAYDPAIISITAGTGAGQSRQIFEYDGANKYAYVNRDWKVTPDNTSKYTIIAHSGDTHINEGVAQAGAAGTITLNSLASASDDIYNSQVVFLVAGTGADQARRIDDYTGATKIATIEPNWIINPDATTVYAVLPTALCSQDILDAILTDTGTTIPTQITALNNISTADVDTALSDIGLDHLVAVADVDDPVNNSILAKMASSDGDWSGFDNATDSLEAIRDRGDVDWSSGGATNPNMLLEAEINTLATQTSFTLATGSDIDNTYNDQAIVLYDDTNSDFPSIRVITDYVGATKTITLDSAPDFTLGTDDSVKIFVTAPGSSAPTVGQIRTEMDNNSTQLAAIVTDTNELQSDDVPGLLSAVDAKIDTIDGIVDAVLIDVTGLNGDAMRGTDSASLASVCTEGRLAELDVGNLPTDISNLNDITVADIIAGVADGSYDLQEMLRIMFAVLAGKTNGGGTATLNLRDSADSKNRVVATVDANGNRTGVVLNGS